MILHNTENPISREERAKINENWRAISSAMATLNNKLIEIGAIDHLVEKHKLEELNERVAVLYAEMNAFSDTHLERINTAIEESNLATADAVNLVNTINSTKAQIDAIAVEVRALIIEANETIDAAVLKAETDVSGFITDATSTLNTATTNANNAATAANTAKTAADNAATAANTAKTNADQATTAANNAATAANAKVAEMTTLGTNLTNQVNTKVSEITALGDDLEAQVNGKVTEANSKIAEMTALGTSLTGQVDVLKADVAATISDAETSILGALDEADAAIAEMQSATILALQLQTKGAYSPTVSYKKNNIVEHDGSSFMALKDSQGVTPPTPEVKTNAAWTLIARRGQDGKGSVVTVNGQSPDASGNVTIVIPPSITKWEELEGVPTEFKPTAHQHQITDVIGLQEALNNSGQATMAKARDIFTATEGQKLFTLKSPYVPGQNLLNVTVGGVPQYPTKNFTETSTTSFTLAEGVPAGEVVVAEYYTGFGGLSAIPTATTDQDGLMPSTDKVKLDGIATGANKTTVTNTLTSTSTSEALAAAQGKLLDEKKADKSTVTALQDKTDQHTGDSAIHVTQAQKDAWNAKRGVRTGGVNNADPNTDTRDVFLCMHANMGDGGAEYWYVEQTWYSTSNNRAQRASTYKGNNPRYKVRSYYEGEGWSPWSDVPSNLAKNDVGMWGTLSSNAGGLFCMSDNAYIDVGNVLRYKNTHASLGARGIIFDWGAGIFDGIKYFNTGNVPATAGAIVNTAPYRLWTDGNAPIKFGFGSPEGSIVASPGTLYLNQSGGFSTLYVKQNGTGNTGWYVK